MEGLGSFRNNLFNLPFPQISWKLTKIRLLRRKQELKPGSKKRSLKGRWKFFKIK